MRKQIFAKGNKGLLDKTRFKKMEQAKILWLKKLSPKKALMLEESLISSNLVLEWRKNFAPDNPVCLKENLKRKRKNATGRDL